LHLLQVHQEALTLGSSKYDDLVCTDLQGSSALIGNHVLIIDFDLLPLGRSNAPGFSTSDIQHLDITL
jgi:hypothetical protein